jgi:hypothetical protein
MKNIIYSLITSLALFAIAGFTTHYSQAKHYFQTSNTTNAVVLELFTSQGCSSCPAADAVLGNYAKDTNSTIIPLSFHVDYWNRLGWKDPFSQAKFSERQYNYSHTLSNTNVYTPQLIINGKYELVGSNVSAIDKIIKTESESVITTHLKIDTIATEGNQLKVWVSANKNKNADLVNVALVKKKEMTEIKRGENTGIKLTNYNIVLDFKSVPIANINSKEILLSYNKAWNYKDYMIVVYLQNSVTGKIVAGKKSELLILNKKGLN